MTSANEQKLPEELWPVRMIAVNVAEAEKEWKYQREELRAAALEAVLDKGVSVVRTAEIAGVGRKTLSLWVEIEKTRRKFED